MTEKFSAFAFDAYGTVFDVAAPLRAVAADYPRLDGPAFATIWRRKQLEYSWLLSLMGAHEDFWAVTQRALDYALAAAAPGLGADEKSALADRLRALYRNLQAYPDARACLEALKAQGYKTAILSNGSPDMLAAAIATAGLSGLLDHVLSAAEAGIFKPAPAVYHLGERAFGRPANEICFVSANLWDCAGASHYGYYVAHIARAHEPAETLPHGPAIILDDLTGLATFAA